MAAESGGVHTHTHTHLVLKGFRSACSLRKYNLLIGEYRGADKSLARPASRCILFDAGLVLYIQGVPGGM